MTSEVHSPRAEQRYFGGTAEADLPVDRAELRTEVQRKYAEVATNPYGEFHFHTGRYIAERCRYDMAAVDALPEQVVESFAGVANPFEPTAIQPGDRVVDLGSGAGFDAVLAARAAGPSGYVVGVDMTPEMITKARANAALAGADNIEFCFGYLEDVPVADGWADVVISNGVINLCPDKDAAIAEISRILKPGGRLQFADIANAATVPDEARRHIDLWTG
jgi:SAM-dependent methyltransferase